jgi:hypothetical protein
MKMPTNRRRIDRSKSPGPITPAILRTFERLLALEAEGLYDSDEGSRLSKKLYAELGTNPWDIGVLSFDRDYPPRWVAAVPELAERWECARREYDEEEVADPPPHVNGWPS